MATVISFEKALKLSEAYNKRHLLTGNGFSIACRPDIFVYGKLFEQADFSKLSPSARESFEALETTDFERVIRALRDATRLVHLYASNPNVKQQMESDADSLRDVLVSTIARSHPERPSDISESEYLSCRAFLDHFDNIYTLNYDLLLYWAVMHVPEGKFPTSDDGFRKSRDDLDADYVVWEPENSHDQNIHYLHGALHIFDAGAETQKYTWVNTGVRLIEQIRNALAREIYPIFVAEGSSREKVQRIKHSEFLAKAYRSFQSIGGCVFIYGHSLAENDEHFLRVLERGRVQHVFIGVYGDPSKPSAQAVIRRGLKMAAARTGKQKLEVTFFDAKSARVWDNPDYATS